MDEAEQKRYPDNIRLYLDRIHAPEKRKFTFHGSSPDEVEQWQRRARPALRELIGLNRIAGEADGFQGNLTIEKEEPCDSDSFVRQYGNFETEPEVRLPFCMLRPAGPGPFPLAIISHGHERWGHDILAGVARDEYPKG